MNHRNVASMHHKGTTGFLGRKLLLAATCVGGLGRNSWRGRGGWERASFQLTTLDCLSPRLYRAGLNFWNYQWIRWNN